MADTTCLNNLITRKLQARNAHSITGHEITIENSKDRLVSYNQKVILLTLEFKNHRLKTDSQVMIRL
jgi:hypothetical protein